MWSRRILLAGIAGVVGSRVLSGCGFRPLYGRSDGADLSNTLSQIEIGPVRNSTTNGPDIARLGQLVRNALLDGFTPRGTHGQVLYRLDVIVTESIYSLAVRKSANATRADLNLSGSFNLLNHQTGESLLSGNSHAISSFNILDSEFTTLMAEKGARDRAAQQFADDIRVKVATFLKNRITKG